MLPASQKEGGAEKDDAAIIRMPDKEKVIVSLTSFPPAIGYAVIAIRSLLAGSVMPDKIVLYLNLSQFPEGRPPREITRLTTENPLVEVRNADEEIRSYLKLIPALKEFPEAVIVTVDDDVYYHRNMLRDLLLLHRKFPGYILAHRAKRLQINTPYKKWRKYRWYHFLTKKYHVSYNTLQTGVGGVLYPPGALKADMINGNEFRELAPTTDDLWFWAAAVANERKVIPVPFGRNKPRGLGKPKVLELKSINFRAGTDGNQKAFVNILSKYPIIRERIENK